MAAKVNCYLPEELRDAFRDRFGPDGSFSEVLRLGVIERLRAAGALELEQLEPGDGGPA